MQTYTLGRAERGTEPTPEQVGALATHYTVLVDEVDFVVRLDRHAQSEKATRALAEMRRSERYRLVLARLVAVRRHFQERPAGQPQIVSVTATPNGPNALPAFVAVGVAA